MGSAASTRGVQGPTGATGATGAAGPTTPVVELYVTDPLAPVTPTTGDGKFYWVVPASMNGMTLTSAHAHQTTVSSSGTTTIQLRNVTQGYDMLTTRITIDVGEKNSYTAATPSVIDTTGTREIVTTGDEIAVDLDVVGTNVRGIIVILTFSA